ncbi:MAG: class I SAM-dependent methyltransferase, partial [Bryobacteraceae bacterium]
MEAYRRFVLRDHVHFVWNAIRSANETGLVLDVGCGGGLFLRMLRETGLPVLGLDALSQAASVAWKSNGVPAVCADLLKAPLRRESCSAITMFHVLEHLYQPEEYLDRARELL